MVAIELSPDHGFVVLAVVATFAVVQWLAVKVAKARDQYGVKYPKMYHEDESHVFNCIQRAHQNTLENYQIFLVGLLTGGLMFPKLCAAIGVWWAFFRVLYGRGYATGDPDKRKFGAIYSGLGLLILMIVNVVVGLRLILQF